MIASRADAIVVLSPPREPVGLLTDESLRRAGALDLPASTPVDALMGTPPIAIDADAYFFEAVHAMLRYRLHHLVVLDSGEPIGIVTDGDLLPARA